MNLTYRRVGTYNRDISCFCIGEKNRVCLLVLANETYSNLNLCFLYRNYTFFSIPVLFMLDDKTARKRTPWELFAAALWNMYIVVQCGRDVTRGWIPVLYNSFLTTKRFVWRKRSKNIIWINIIRMHIMPKSCHKTTSYFTLPAGSRPNPAFPVAKACEA